MYLWQLTVNKKKTKRLKQRLISSSVTGSNCPKQTATPGLTDVR